MCPYLLQIEQKSTLFDLFDYCKIYLSLISQNFYYKFLLKKNILLNGVNQKINK